MIKQFFNPNYACVCGYVVVDINSNFGKEFRSLLWHNLFKVRKQCISCFALEPCIVTANKAKVVGREVTSNAQDQKIL